jgi:hypothetical protein
MTSVIKETPSQRLRKKIGKLEFSEIPNKKNVITFEEFVRIAKAAAKTFKEDESNSRRELSV